MVYAPRPADEVERITALKRYDILDTPSEAEFDDLTFLASEICATPIALISLIDSDRQWFKSKRGIEISETSRDFAFCSYALLSHEFLEVPDAIKDERFQENPFVIGEPRIRFYAGGPLTTPEGMVVGTLCVVDRKPRRLSKGQREALMALARQVVRQMELRLASREEKRLRENSQRAEEALAASEERLRILNGSLEQLIQERTAKLRESAEQHRALTESATDGIVSTDHESRILSWNKAAEKIFGYSSREVIGQPLKLLIPERFIKKYEEGMKQYLHTGDVGMISRTFELHGRHRNGQEFPMELSASTWRTESGQYFSGIFRDLTEMRESEKQRLRAQRLESLGTLSGGIAHDLNNALAPIMMGVELLRLSNPEQPEVLETIETSARHGAAMVRQLLTFAKGVEGERLLIQPRHLLREMITLIKGAFPKNIELRSNYENQPLAVLGDATQLHQVLLNLCVNARDAMPKGGILTLEIDQKTLDSKQAGQINGAKPGSYVVCRVRDTGIGIPLEVMEHIFEPFFSTKGPDKGTGLGLSTVLGIVKSHDGFVKVDSIVGKGTIFSVFLPLADCSSTGGNTVVSSKTAIRGNGELVLVVDDEPTVRRMVRTILSTLNFRVITAEDGAEALVQVAENRAYLRCVITDVHMPHMAGSSFVRVLRRMIPEASILVSSGYLEDQEIREFNELGVNTFLNKPFTQEELIEKLALAFNL